jgi:hypothetical protein
MRLKQNTNGRQGASQVVKMPPAAVIMRKHEEEYVQTSKNTVCSCEDSGLHLIAVLMDAMFDSSTDHIVEDGSILTMRIVGLWYPVYEALKRSLWS